MNKILTNFLSHCQNQRIIADFNDTKRQYLAIFFPIGYTTQLFLMNSIRKAIPIRTLFLKEILISQYDTQTFYLT